MKKYMLCLLLLFAMRIATYSQLAATEGKIEYQKGDKPAAVIEIPYSPGIVEAAIKDMQLKNGIKEERLKGMLVYKGARLTPTDGEIVDLYVYVDKKGKKNDNASIVYLILGRPNENVSLRTADDAFRIPEAKDFLNRFVPVVEAYNLELNIAQQEEVIRKTEKKFSSLDDDKKEIENEIRELQDKLEQVKRDQEAVNAEISKQRSVRDGMLSRRVSSVK